MIFCCANFRWVIINREHIYYQYVVYLNTLLPLGNVSWYFHTVEGIWDKDKAFKGFHYVKVNDSKMTKAQFRRVCCQFKLYWYFTPTWLPILYGNYCHKLILEKKCQPVYWFDGTVIKSDVMKAAYVKKNILFNGFNLLSLNLTKANLA